MLGLGNLIPTGRIERAGNWLTYNSYWRNQAADNPNGRQLIQAAALGSAKMSVNGELTVTNLIPPVNRDTPFREVTKAA